MIYCQICPTSADGTNKLIEKHVPKAKVSLIIEWLSCLVIFVSFSINIVKFTNYIHLYLSP